MTTTEKNYSAAGNIDVTTARYSPAFPPGQPRRYEPRDDVPLPAEQPLRRDHLPQQRSSPPRQNGYGGGFHDNPYGVREDPDARRTYPYSEQWRPTADGPRTPTDRDLQYRSTSSHEERVDTPQSGRLSQAALMIRQAFEEDGDFDQEVAVSRDFGLKGKGGEGDEMMLARNRRQHQYQRQLSASEMIARLDVHNMLVDAPVTSVRQTIDVERLEDEIVSGPVPVSGTPAITVGVASIDKIAASIGDYDTVSELVDMHVTDDGQAVSTARVRCERTIPVRGSGNIFQRSSVIVTKRIQVDLTVNMYRRRLWRAIRGVNTTLTDAENGSRDANEGPLSKSDTLVLYNKFKQLVELNKTGHRVTN